jgi:MoaA/NifB/PqqE/SkfB family radical SAM enzyme
MKIIRQPAYDLKTRPFLVIWETTRACDLACRHCRAESSPNPDPRSLSFQAGCDLIDQVDRFGLPHPLFIMTGGDPFKRPDIFELVQYASSKGIPAALSPSGTPLLTADALQKLYASGCRVISLSLDGSDAVRHDDFRQVRGSFDWTVSGWKQAQAAGLKLQINTTVTRYNLFDLSAIFNLVRSLGSITWSVFFLVPTGRGLQQDEISPDDYEAVLNFLYDASKFMGIKTTEGHHYKPVVLQRSVLEGHGIPPEKNLGLNDTYRQLKAQLAALNLPVAAPEASRMKRAPLHVNSASGFVFISYVGNVYPSGICR